MPTIINKEEIDSWLFDHAQKQVHICDGIKNALGINVAWQDRTTGETIEVFYKDFTYKELLVIQLAEYPSSVILNWGQLKQLHHTKQFHVDTISWYEEHHPQAVCYYLTEKSLPDGHYNGIRYGDAGDYCSFSHINPKDLHND